MDKTLLKKIIKLWFLLAVLATLNGIIRNAAYKPVVGDLLAHQISTFIYIAVILIVVFLFFRKMEALPASKDLIQVGIVWLLATIGFEFIFGHYVFGNSWEKLLADYNIFVGRIWSLVIVALFCSPYLIGKILAKKAK